MRMHACAVPRAHVGRIDLAHDARPDAGAGGHATPNLARLVERLGRAARALHHADEAVSRSVKDAQARLVEWRRVDLGAGGSAGSSHVGPRVARAAAEREAQHVAVVAKMRPAWAFCAIAEAKGAGAQVIR